MLTFYTDESAWLNAMSGNQIGQLTDPASISRQQQIVQLQPDGYCCLPPIDVSDVSQAPFTSFQMTLSSFYIDSGQPVTLDREVLVDLPAAINGFAVYGVGFPQYASDGFSLNGQFIPDPTGGGYGQFPFLGIVSDNALTSLDFWSNDCLGFFVCDNGDEVRFDSIVVAQDGAATRAQVAEPITWPLLMIGLAMVLYVKARVP